jgi:hypothetical protein
MSTDPTPPVPTPPTPPTPPASWGSRVTTFIKTWATPLAIFVLAGAIIFHTFSPVPSNPVTLDAKKLGQNYGLVLRQSYADACKVTASDLRAGKKVTEAQADFVNAWKTAREAAFVRDVKPLFNPVLPEGTEDPSSTQRQAAADLWEKFAAGVSGK